MLGFKPIKNKRPFESTKPNKPKQQQRRRNKNRDSDEEEFDDPDESKPRPQQQPQKPTNKKMVFDDDGNTIEAPRTSNGKGYNHKSNHASSNGQTDVDTKWYQMFAGFNTDGELVEMKDVELNELTKSCRSCFEAELNNLQKQNPSDAKWLQTALHKGTSKDRANAGALLVQSNPLANLQALETLITLAKVSNKTSAGAVDVITELFISALLPPNRKLFSLALRGADWKALKKNDVDKSQKDGVMAYWHFEQELKEQYFEFLRNVQAAIQGNQDVQKNQAIICTSRLLCYAPEKEQLLLSLLINKLGDPSNKVASKALHHLNEVVYKHPAMCEVMTMEAEKLLFRNNITEHAQHFALCFLSSIAPRGNANVCTRLVQICFSFFKVVVQKGVVNSKTMQAILRCLQRAIVDGTTDKVKDNADSDGILTKEIQDTMYRLVHLADIHITLQTLALLLQVMSVKSGNYDRFYNALYRKMLDMNLVNIGPKAAAQFLHIMHRAIYMDANVPRTQAFVKRLLQIAIYFPTHLTCGCLVVISKLLKSRPEIGRILPRPVDTTPPEEDVSNDVSVEVNKSPEDTEIEYETVKDQPQSKNSKDSTNAAPRVVDKTKYNPYNRSAAYSGAEFALKTELLNLAKHFHPTVQLFAQNIIDSRAIAHYGDPLKDFCLTQFLERFSFRNPKKLDQKVGAESLAQVVHHKNYKAHGGRGQPVQNLTKTNCTEDERFIFQYLEQKREKRLAIRKAYGKDGAGDDSDDGEVNDDEFDAYLDGLGGKKGAEDDDLDFMGDLGDELNEDDGKTSKKKNKKKKKATDEEDEGAGDWEEDAGDSDGDDLSLNGADEDDENDFGSDGSVSLNGDDDDDEDGSDIFEDSDGDELDPSDEDDNDDDEAPKSKKARRMTVSDRDFEKKLKNTDDMSSLFAAADDFSEMLQETGKSKSHGTLGDLFNKDKSSEKQMAWEAKRFKDHGAPARSTSGNKFAKGKHYGGHKYKGNKNLGRSNQTKKRKY